MSAIQSRKISVSLNHLPDEVLQQILFYLEPQDILRNVQRLSKRFHTLGGEPLLWRHYCETEFRYWDPKHNIRLKFAAHIEAVDWKQLYARRKAAELETTEVLDSILETQTDRISKFERIAQLGYDAKDTLIRNFRTDPEVDDGLARR